MNNEELIQARKNYRNSLKENEKLSSIQKELEELKQSKEVLRYLELIQYENEPVQTDEELALKAFDEVCSNTKDKSDIYVFMGSYQKVYGSGADVLSREKNASWTDYNLYWNIETEGCIKVHKYEQSIEHFEKKHIVIDNKVVPLSNEFIDYYKNFKQIQTTYYKALTYTTQDKALKKIKKVFN